MRIIRLVAAAAFLAVCGCSRLPDATYTLRADAERLDIPQKHKDQIAAWLAAFHGTPANPRMALPDPEADIDTSAAGVAAITRIDAPGYDRLHLQLGRQVYTQQCAGCHGTTGDGNGPAGPHLNPPPRDYRNGVFKFTSTPRGSKPRRDDLRRILRYGAKGTSMPAFRFFSDEETEAVIDYVQVLAARGELEINLIREATDELDEDDDFDPEVVAEFVTDIANSWHRADDELVRAVTVNPPRTPETIHAGAVAFAELYCVKCHGPDARGSKSADVGEDIWGRTAYPANLAMGMLHGGRRPIDIYRRIYSGINGTPMPSSKDPNTAIGETPEERSDRIWHLVHFVTEIIEANAVPEDAQEAIFEVLRKQAEPVAPETSAEEEPAKAAALPGRRATVPALAGVAAPVAGGPHRHVVSHGSGLPIGPGAEARGAVR
jgi:mono/diheme cytochrome c family protein